MTILLTGGSGTTARRIASRLKASSVPFVVASRNQPSQSGHPTDSQLITAKFDWYDPSTYENSFQTSLGVLDRVYLCQPPAVHQFLPALKAFIDFIHAKGVRRIVLLNSGAALPGTEEIEVEDYIIGLGVDYCILKPTWFSDNFATGYADEINTNNSISSATKDGKVAFVCADDIADLATTALTIDESYNKQFFIFGPELLSFDMAADILSDVLGRPILHTRISTDALRQRLIDVGITDDYAGYLAHLENTTADGHEEFTYNTQKFTKWVGNTTLKEYIEINKALWLA